MITAIWTTVLLVAFFLLLAWQLGKDKGKEQGYFEGYKKGFSDAQFLSNLIKDGTRKAASIRNDDQ